MTSNDRSQGYLCGHCGERGHNVQTCRLKITTKEQSEARVQVTTKCGYCSGSGKRTRLVSIKCAYDLYDNGWLTLKELRRALVGFTKKEALADSEELKN